MCSLQDKSKIRKREMNGLLPNQFRIQRALLIFQQFMKAAAFIILHFCIALTCYCQSQKSLKGEFSFGSRQGGAIELSSLLTDSVAFIGTNVDTSLGVRGFNLITRCDGITRIYRSEKGGKLTNEMKENVSKLKPGCEIEFSFTETFLDWTFRYSTVSYTNDRLKFTFKQQ